MTLDTAVQSSRAIKPCNQAVQSSRAHTVAAIVDVTMFQVLSCLLIALPWFANAQLQCPRITVDVLGNTTEFSTNGLLASSLQTVGESGATVVPVKINNYTILCDASGSRRNTSSYVSVLVDFQCSFTGGTDNLAKCDGMTNITRQYQYTCSSRNEWINQRVVQTLNSTATFQTELNDRCRLCGDPTEFSTDPDTHCLCKYLEINCMSLWTVMIMPLSSQHVT